MSIQGSASTPNASRYLQQVCKHWGHRFTSNYDPDHGTVDFGDGSAVDLTAEPEQLLIIIRCEPDSNDMLKEIVEEHIQRFAHKEGTLEFRWSELPPSQA